MASKFATVEVEIIAKDGLALTNLLRVADLIDELRKDHPMIPDVQELHAAFREFRRCLKVTAETK